METGSDRREWFLRFYVQKKMRIALGLPSYFYYLLSLFWNGNSADCPATYPVGIVPNVQVAL